MTILQQISELANYAEKGPTFDPVGKYLCGSCSLRAGSSACLWVSGRINFKTGGCRFWITGPVSKDELDNKISQKEASYGERPKAKGFGCSRCEYSKENNSDGKRSLDCEFWETPVMPEACCAQEDGDDLIEAPGEDKIQQAISDEQEAINFYKQAEKEFDGEKAELFKSLREDEEGHLSSLKKIEASEE